MIAQFSLRLVFGMSLMWAVMPRREVTSGFFRIQMLVTLGLSVLSALSVGRLTGAGIETEPEAASGSYGALVGLCATLGVVSFLGSVFWTLERRRAGTITIFIMSVLSAGALLYASLLSSTQETDRVLLLLSEVSAATMLGAATTGMLLGHWYLTAPGMKLAPLNKLNLYFGVAVAARLLISALALYSARGTPLSDVQWIWLGLRWAAGIAGPIAVVWMVWRILKYRNTQAATGVLFVGVILTFIGEMTSSLLFGALGRSL